MLQDQTTIYWFVFGIHFILSITQLLEMWQSKCFLVKVTASLSTGGGAECV